MAEDKSSENTYWEDYSGGLSELSGGRTIIKESHGTSSADNLFRTDTSNIITVASNWGPGVKLVYMETTTNGAGMATVGDVEGMTLGIRPNSYPSDDWVGNNSDRYNYIASDGVYTSNNLQIPFAVVTIGSESSACLGGKYGKATTIAICKFDDTQNVGISQFYVSAEGAASNSSINPFIGTYRTYGDGSFGWSHTDDLHGIHYAFIALTTKNKDTINGYEYTFYAGNTYTIDMYIHCASLASEGMILLSRFSGSESHISLDSYGNSVLTDFEEKILIKGNASDKKKTFTYTPETNKKLYFCFVTTEETPIAGGNLTHNNDCYRYGYVRINRNVNVTITAPSSAASDVVIHLPRYEHIAASDESNPRGIVDKDDINFIEGDNNIFFELDVSGVYGVSNPSEYNNNNMVLDVSNLNSFNNYIYYTGKNTGGFTKDRRIEDSTAIWYSHWKNRLAAYEDYMISSLSMWCTDDPKVASSVADYDKPIKVANSEMKCASGQSVIVSYSGDENFYYYPDTYQPTKYLYVKKNTPSGTYNLGSITFTSPSGTYYSSDVETYYFPSITINPVSVASYSAVTKPSVSQISDIPANGVSLNSGNLSSYFSGYGSTQTITYTNDKTGSGSITYSFGGSISLSSLGTTYKPNRETVGISSNAIYVKATGGGSESSTSYISSVTYASNDVSLQIYPVDSTLLSVSVISMSVDDYFDMCILARYTSGAVRDLVGDGPESGVAYSIMAPSFLVVGSI